LMLVNAAYKLLSPGKNSFYLLFLDE